MRAPLCTNLLKPWLGRSLSTIAAVLPDPPAMAQTLPGYDISNWCGLDGPKGIAKPVVRKLDAETPRVLSMPQLRQSFEREAVEIVASTPEAFGDYLTSEMVQWGRLVKSSGLKLE